MSSRQTVRQYLAAHPAQIKNGCNHFNREHSARGMCKPCYDIAYRNANPVRQQQHRDYQREYARKAAFALQVLKAMGADIDALYAGRANWTVDQIADYLRANLVTPEPERPRPMFARRDLIA
jgi:hypothetical protein